VSRPGPPFTEPVWHPLVEQVSSPGAPVCPAGGPPEKAREVSMTRLSVNKITHAPKTKKSRQTSLVWTFLDIMASGSCCAGKRLDPASTIFIAGKVEPHPVRKHADTVAFAA
jgi:hypothetical protein